MWMDSEIRKRARNAIRGILEAASFEVAELEEPLDLSGTRGEECVVLMCSDAPEAIAEFDHRNYRFRSGSGEISCRKLLFTLNQAAQVRSCIVWGPKELAAHAGEAVVAEVLGRTIGLDLSHAPPAAAAEEMDASGPALLHLPLKVNAATALKTAGIEGAPFLRFIPHWQYSASCAGERQYKGKGVVFSCDRRGFINAINGQQVELDAQGASKGNVPRDAEVLAPKVTKEAATERVRGEIMEEQAKKIRIRQEKGDAIFYEEKVFRPEPSEVKVTMELLYVPVWSVKGKKIVEVNGVTGEVLTEPMDEGVEVF